MSRTACVLKGPDVILMTQEAVGGLTNEGYWGVPVQAGRHYAVSMRLASTQKAGLLPSPHPCWNDCSISACTMLSQCPW